jgi:hypothetical protein
MLTFSLLLIEVVFPLPADELPDVLCEVALPPSPPCPPLPPAPPCEEVTLTFLLSEFPEFLMLESEELLPEFLMEESEELFPEFLIELFPLSLTVLLEFPLSFIEPPAPPNAVLVFVVFELSVTDPPFATGALTFVLDEVLVSFALSTADALPPAEVLEELPPAPPLAIAPEFTVP